LIKEFPDKFTSLPQKPVSETLFPPPSLYFDKNTEALAEMFNSSVSNGLKSEQVATNRSYYGHNKLPPPPKASLLKMIWTQVTDFMVVILIIAAIVEFATGDRDAAYVLLAVVLINVTIGVTQEYKANQALEALLTLTVAKVTKISNKRLRLFEEVYKQLLILRN
jgi:Ca2+-transporting ATPase